MSCGPQKVSNSFDSYERRLICVELVLDSWGKLPSGILNGNGFEFGSFSQCFDIDKNGEQYKTKYCLAQTTFHLDGFLSNYPQLNIISPYVFYLKYRKI